MSKSKKNSSEAADDFAAKLLHYPARVHELSSAEAHAGTAARLARALWLLVHSEYLDTDDERDVDALREIAGVIADHASAAVYVIGKG